MNNLLRFLILLLIHKRHLTIPDLMESLGTSRRSIYRYINQLCDAGFSVSIIDKRVVLDPHSPVFKELDALMYFNKDEAVSLYNAIDTIEINSQVKEKLKEKLMSMYGTTEVREKIIRLHASEKVRNLMYAIEHKKAVTLVGYSSPSSQSKKDRLVEPFKIGEEYKMVWCYELETGLNKVFMISRIDEVRVDENSRWHFETSHQSAFTDAFHMISFSGQRLPVKLIMNRRATELLREEYPLAQQDIKYCGMEYWMLETVVSSYVGIGRFVLGLLDCIKILTPGLQEYCRDYVKRNLND